MRGALKHLAHVETCSPPRTSDGCQKLLNAYKLIRELKGVDKEEKKLLNDAVDDLRTILQVSQYLLIIYDYFGYFSLHYLPLIRPFFKF